MAIGKFWSVLPEQKVELRPRVYPYKENLEDDVVNFHGSMEYENSKNDDNFEKDDDFEIIKDNFERDSINLNGSSDYSMNPILMSYKENPENIMEKDENSKNDGNFENDEDFDIIDENLEDNVVNFHGSIFYTLGSTIGQMAPSSNEENSRKYRALSEDYPIFDDYKTILRKGPSGK